MCWIDFKKAFDMVPHSWIIKVMKAYGIAENITRFIEVSMSTWNVWLYHKGVKLCNVPIRRGIFQGDSLSPLLFIMCLFPLSHTILQKSCGYQLNANTIAGTDRNNLDNVTINHLLYVDDIKLYSKSEKSLRKMIAQVKEFSDNIKMEFGFEKCKIVNINRGKLDPNTKEP